jgi:4a-hydroxytetrahydrobiopterin dehydratase
MTTPRRARPRPSPLGGRLISDENAPTWWALADPEGNEVDVATTLGRD